MIRSLLLALCVSAPATGFGQDIVISEEIAAGFTWEYYSSADEVPHSITQFVVDPTLIEIDIVGSSDSLIGTSSFALNNYAFAGINGSFFDMKNGGSAVFFQDEKKLITEANGRKAYSSETAMTIGKNGDIDIITRPEKDWKRKGKYRDILASGPLLVSQGQNKVSRNDSFHTTKHPRTALGIRGDGILVFVVVDGRTEGSSGMSLSDLSEWFIAQGCVIAMNLDGGGSSTAWLKGRSENGIVNYPSDNRYFDHFGERGVANAIIFR